MVSEIAQHGAAGAGPERPQLAATSPSSAAPSVDAAASRHTLQPAAGNAGRDDVTGSAGYSDVTPRRAAVREFAAEVVRGTQVGGGGGSSAAGRRRRRRRWSGRRPWWPGPGAHLLRSGGTDGHAAGAARAPEVLAAAGLAMGR